MVDAPVADRPWVVLLMRAFLHRPLVLGLLGGVLGMALVVALYVGVTWTHARYLEFVIMRAEIANLQAVRAAVQQQVPRP